MIKNDSTNNENEKRFIINNNMDAPNKIETYELSCVVDTKNKTFYFIVDSIANVEMFVERLNNLNEENQLLKQRNIDCEIYVDQLIEEIRQLRKDINLIHMQSMFSTVKSFKGDVSKRYFFNDKTGIIYDTANHYGQYYKELNKKEVTMLLNEYETLLHQQESNK